MFSESIRNNLLLNLVSEWTFNNSSNLGSDSWGSNNGVNHGATAVTNESQCVSGGCASFDGSNDYISITNNNELISKEITLSAWVKANSITGVDSIISKAYAYKIRLYSTDYSVNLQIGGVNFYTPSNTISSNQWYYLLGIYNGSTVKIYINGEEKFFQNHSIDPFGTSLLSIGAYADGVQENFNGLIDEVQIYNTAISESQVKQNYLLGLNNLYAKGLIGEIEYNERLSESK
jgi:hypothetical protein